MRTFGVVAVLMLGAGIGKAEVLVQNCVTTAQKQGPIYKVRVSQGVQLRNKVLTPEIPLGKEDAKLLRSLGELKVTLNIGTNGMIECYELRSSKTANLTPDVTARLKKSLDGGFADWRFSPYIIEDRPTEVETTWEFAVKKGRLRYRKP